MVDSKEIKYRIIVGEDGDDFIFQGGLSWDRAWEVLKDTRRMLQDGAYARVEYESN